MVDVGAWEGCWGIGDVGAGRGMAHVGACATGQRAWGMGVGAWVRVLGHGGRWGMGDVGAWGGCWGMGEVGAGRGIAHVGACATGQRAWGMGVGAWCKLGPVGACRMLRHAANALVPRIPQVSRSLTRVPCVASTHGVAPSHHRTSAPHLCKLLASPLHTPHTVAGGYGELRLVLGVAGR